MSKAALFFSVGIVSADDSSSTLNGSHPLFAVMDMYIFVTYTSIIMIRKKLYRIECHFSRLPRRVCAGFGSDGF